MLVTIGLLSFREYCIIFVSIAYNANFVKCQKNIYLKLLRVIFVQTIYSILGNILSIREIHDVLKYDVMHTCTITSFYEMSLCLWNSPMLAKIKLRLYHGTSFFH